ncbi:MAG: hypothetical protein NT069_18840 [Planctomycetota bacterium]|nr:hypothetical protein [Planctomycetota bacterium]
MNAARKLDATNGGAVAAGALISISGPIDGKSAGGNDTLLIQASTGAGADGDVDLSGAVEGGAGTQNVTGGEDLEGLVVAGNVVNLRNIVVAGPITVTASGAGANIVLNGTDYQSTLVAANVQFNGPVELKGGATTVQANAGTVNFNDNLDGKFDLNVVTDGTTRFGGVVGGITSLTSLTTSPNGTTLISGNVTTSGFQTYNDAVTLLQDATLKSDLGQIKFSSTVDGARNLTVETGGATIFADTVGTASVSTDAPGTTQLTKDVTTTGAQSFGDNVTLLANVTAKSTGGGNIRFGGAVNGTFGLVVDTAGGATLGGAVGTPGAGIASLEVTATTGIALNGGSVTTTGNLGAVRWHH